VLYVFEGSKNGARYIARALRGSLRISGAPGLRYLDPHGEAQRPVWESFKQRLDAAPLDAAEVDGIILAAKACFAHVTAVDGALLAEAPRSRVGTAASHP
jgi:heme oxygenase